MIELVIASSALLVLGLLILWWARACRRGTLPRNWIFGYRTVLTLRDQDAWVSVHRATAPYLLIAGIGVTGAAVIGIVLAVTGVTDVVPALLGSSIGWLLVWVLISFVPAVRAERNYKRALNST